MSFAKRMLVIRIWGDPASQLQIIVRRMSSISALFSMIAAVAISGPQWLVVVALAVTHIMYNLVFCWQRPKLQLGELVLNLALCAGFTLAGALYSEVLYHLLLMRMVLRGGRSRVWRMVAVVSFVYMAAHSLVAGAFTAAFWLEHIYNIIAFAVVSFTTVYMLRVVESQQQQEGQIAQLMRENARHYKLAHTDELTGLLNHRSYLEKTADLQQYALLIVDIDHFKQLNDAYGHLFGDQVLTTIGNIISMNIRSKDMAFRYGGEEFALVLPGTSLELGFKIAERLRFQVSNCDFFHHGERVKVTISIGVALKQQGLTCQDAFQEADSALYRAKRQGRNQCVVFETAI
ncbi:MULTISPECIES: diguanylate cyclase [Sporomusa]|uniref:GGDEF domain-containing protein n=1 Tax=Sporomusa TaxID=2375 RepID=UPI0016683616|nr:diguanylate cyclase [Sporomusa sp. GT1]MCM0760369.1 diguanylate cyclase [Sporomusa sphaeroides DSM 2875]